MTCSIGWEGLCGFTTKSPGGSFTGLSLKTKDRFDEVKVRVEVTWRHLRAYFGGKGKLRRSHACPMLPQCYGPKCPMSGIVS